MVKIKIDGVEYEVDEKKNLIDAAKDVGVDIPYFCYHPALKVVGMCRMCLIEIEGVPRLQAACNTAIREGLSIITKSQRVREAREGTMEFLLANHPLDCPVCDKAGECQLQDNAFQEGKGKSRFEFEKRNIPQEEIGTNLIINHNRCIICYRCVRFEEEILGESNLGLFERGYHSIIGLAKSEPIRHNYQGALADICPVGALLNKNMLFKSRVWYYKTFESVCHGCSTGCNVYVNVRDNKVYRYMPRPNPEQGKYFICDKGRFDLDWMHTNRLFTYYKKGNPSKSTEVIPELTELWEKANRIAILGGAHEPNEVLESTSMALNTLRNISGAKEIIWESRVLEPQYKEPEQIDFLLTTDYHPNTRGALDLNLTVIGGIQTIQKDFQEGKIDLLFVIKESIPQEFIDAFPEKIVLLHSNIVPELKKIQYGIPVRIFAEEGGSFTNKEGIRQSFQASLKPPQGLLSTAGLFHRILEQIKNPKKEVVHGNY